MDVEPTTEPATELTTELTAGQPSSPLSWPAPPQSPPDGVVRNADVDWDRWPVQDYLAENYRQLHPSDAALIDHHAGYLRGIAPDSLECSLEFGAGPNLYPLLLVGACSRRIDAVEPGAANVAYLRRQLTAGMDDSWRPFYDRCRAGNPGLPADPAQVLRRIRVIRADGRDVAADLYDLVSMHFVAEGATEDRDEFTAFCRTFVAAARPAGHVRPARGRAAPAAPAG